MSIEDSLGNAPKDRPVVLLLRHAERPPIPPGSTGHDLALTAAGKLAAIRYGHFLGSQLRSISSSPVPRCMQTASAIREGAGAQIEIQPDRLLGDPGIYVANPEAAWRNWQNLGHEGVARHLLTQEIPLRGMANPSRAAKQLLQHMLDRSGDEVGLHTFVTHDYLVSVTANRLFGNDSGRDWCPPYLASVAFWRENDVVHCHYIWGAAK